MSMISSLIDRLRQMADGQATYRAAREVMLEAADTIWQLRDDLQRANAENAKLRESLEFANSEWEKDSLEFLNMRNENAKLRELVRDMYKSMDVSCQFGHAIPAGTMAHVKNRAIGLGIEVDG